MGIKKVVQAWNSVSLVKRIVIGLVIGGVLGVAVPNIEVVELLGTLFVSALKGVAPILVFFLVISALANARAAGSMKTVVLLYVVSTFVAALVAVVASFLFPIELTLSAPAADQSSPSGIGEVLGALVMNVVSNPVDILTHVALKLSGMPEYRVIGSGTVLDTARFKYILGEHLGVDPRNVHARIIGEHGDSEIAVWSTANISGIPVNDFCELRGHFEHDESMQRIAEDVKNSAYEIIAKKKATYYGIAMSVKRICEAIVRDEKPILPVSNFQNGVHGLHDVVLSMPAVVGKNGIEYQVPAPLSTDELARLHESAKALREVIDGLDLE